MFFKNSFNTLGVHYVLRAIEPLNLLDANGTEGSGFMRHNEE